jgi:hypothetical protein
MRAQTVITIEPAAGGNTRIVVTSHLPGGRQPISQTSVEMPQDTIRGLVLDLCKKAGLPAPWKG